MIKYSSLFFRDYYAKISLPVLSYIIKQNNFLYSKL